MQSMNLFNFSLKMRRFYLKNLPQLSKASAKIRIFIDNSKGEADILHSILCITVYAYLYL